MKLCNLPASSTISAPGRNHKWYVLLKMIFAPISSNSSGDIDFTVASVPTGINIGVGKVPCGVMISPRRAPVCFSVLISLYFTAGSVIL